VDWNNDGIFMTLAKSLFQQCRTNQDISFSFLLPVLALVILQDHTVCVLEGLMLITFLVGCGQGPCYIGTWATFEDYTISVVPPPPPLTIQDISETLL
jgi:hypothetical protein